MSMSMVHDTQAMYFIYTAMQVVADLVGTGIGMGGTSSMKRRL